MMGRLIDEDDLIDRLRQEEWRLDEVNTVKDFKEIVDTVNTAYEVDAVVAELKEWSFETEIVIPGSDGYDDTANREIICTKNAIDIVRKGGVE